MVSFGPKSVRGRVTLMASVATALAMALIVVVMGLVTRAILEDAIADSLRERLDQARTAVSAGDYDLVIDLAGNEVIQVIDAKGNVVAGSRNARGLAAISDDDDDADEEEVDDLEFERTEPEPPAADQAPAESGATGGSGAVAVAPTVSSPSGGGGGGGGSADSDDDDDDDDGRAGSVEVDDDDDDDDDDAASSGARTREADDDDDDDDDGKKSAKKSSSNKPSSAKAKSSTLPLGAFPPFTHNLAWADEPVSPQASGPNPPSSNARADEPAALANPAASVDAASVLGKEGPYLILKDQVESPDGPMTIVAVTSLEQATRSAIQMMWLLAAIMAAVLAAVVVLTWVLTGRTLRPVEQMRREAASITAANLGDRIDVPQGDRDLAPLAETLNEMLARVERSLEEEKRFISDASHELKSPIAATSIILDSMRAHPDEADVPQAIEDLASENARMASVVGDMLALTRYDEGRLNCKPEPIDVMDVVLEEAMALKARSDVEVDVSEVQPLTCRADAGLLSHALRNLLDNAARYAASRVKVTCEAGEDGAVVIRVSDDGPGIAPDDRERVFGRFVCLDERSGTGLGLPVARTIIAAHGGTLTFTDPDPALSGATAEILLPQKQAT